MKARVLMLTHQCAGRGGSFMRAVSMARPLFDMGYDMTVLASRATIGLSLKRSEWHGVRIVEMPDLLPWRLRNAGLSPVDLVGRLLYSAGSFDILHAFDHRPCASLPALWRTSQGTPFVSDWADLWGLEGLGAFRHAFPENILAKMDDWLEPYVRTHCSAVTAVSAHLRDSSLRLGLSPERVRVIPAGSNSDLIVPMDKLAARARYGLPADAPILACSGFSSLDADLLTTTFLELVKILPEVRLIMSGSRIEPFERLLAAAGVGGNVIHFGVQPYESLGQVLACGDVMWLPYGDTPENSARFPNRFGEYIAAARPIATNPGGDHSLIVDQEVIGIITLPRPAESAQGIAALLRDPQRCAEMGSRARTLATSRLSWNSIAGSVAELYDKLC